VLGNPETITITRLPWRAFVQYQSSGHVFFFLDLHFYTATSNVCTETWWRAGGQYTFRGLGVSRIERGRYRLRAERDMKGARRRKVTGPGKGIIFFVVSCCQLLFGGVYTSALESSRYALNASQIWAGEAMVVHAPKD
jgi:hypothetical protein